MLYDDIQEAVAYIRSRTDFQARYGIILGTGLGKLTEEIEVEQDIPYRGIPHFPESTVRSHRSRLYLGFFHGLPVAALAGRFHYYEGYSMQQVTFPVRVLRMLGVERLVISNAAGSVNPDIRPGHLVFVRDHINLHAENPLRGRNDERLGPRFPDMLRAYDRRLNARVLEVAAAHGIPAHEGVYLGLQGPNLETPAEYRMAHILGADLVGMSTIPEVIAACHMDLPVFVVSVATNACYPIEAIQPTTVEEVIQVAQAAEPRMRLVVREVLKMAADA
jgi:purine-nucleoside phosphorylase